mmetsp:Transcript_68532/g.150768  ORF Transcript_68532/g.150768 Transcript_68532/m.150768 type:complete len:319 (-) Transcript_68532:510-1466(-)
MISSCILTSLLACPSSPVTPSFRHTSTTQERCTTVLVRVLRWSRRVFHGHPTFQELIQSMIFVIRWPSTQTGGQSCLPNQATRTSSRLSIREAQKAFLGSARTMRRQDITSIMTRQPRSRRSQISKLSRSCWTGRSHMAPKSWMVRMKVELAMMGGPLTAIAVQRMVPGRTGQRMRLHQQRRRKYLLERGQRNQRRPPKKKHLWKPRRHQQRKALRMLKKPRKHPANRNPKRQRTANHLRMVLATRGCSGLATKNTMFTAKAVKAVKARAPQKATASMGAMTSMGAMPKIWTEMMHRITAARKRRKCRAFREAAAFPC